jgi:hypothetical protein
MQPAVRRLPPRPPERARPEPLSHHGILVLAAPFSRAGWRVDLQASERAERHLAFMPRSHPTPQGTLTERLELVDPIGGPARLVRTLTAPDGLRATAEALATSPAALLEAMETLTPDVHFARAEGVAIAYSYRLDHDGDGWRAILRRAEAHPGGMTLTLDTRPAPGALGRFELLREDGEPRDLPDDILAVLGLAWRPLRHARGGWSAYVWITRREPGRSADAASKMERTVAHLARTLAAPPARYHADHVRARWGVLARRALMLLLGLGVLAAAPLIMVLPVGDASTLRMLAFHLPPLLLVGLFTLRELPSLMPPPVPRRPRDDAWGPASIAAPDPRGASGDR